MQQTDSELFTPKNRADWRKWLNDNHLSKPAVWLVLYKKSTGIPTVSWSDIVDEALCFGWIDGKRITIDETAFKQFLCKRKPTGTWSKINKEKVERLTAAGLMAPAGIATIVAAKENGSWNLLDDVEALKIPADLEHAFSLHKGSKAYFTGLSKSVRKMMLQWVLFARRPETRRKRINEIAELAAKQLKPKPF